MNHERTAVNRGGPAGRSRRLLCALLMFPLVGSAWGHGERPVEYRAPLLITVHDSQSPSQDCTAAAVKTGDTGKVPLTMLASACAAWTAETCEIWMPQTGFAAVWSVASSMMSPTMILGHEAMHCWKHDYHGVLPWF